MAELLNFDCCLKTLRSWAVFQSTISNQQLPPTPLCYNQILSGGAIQVSAEVVELADTPS
jgi:hypothetical protein